MVLWCIFIASIVQLSYCANVYYKLSSQSQDVFGPFAEQQVIGWLEQGYFDVTQVVISREHEDAFIPMGRYFSRESNYDHSSTIVNDDPSNAISYNPSDDQRYDGGEDRHVYYDDRNHQPSVEDYGYNPVGTIGRPSSGILSSLSRRASSLITSNTKGLLDITKIIRKKISHSASSVVGISSGSGMRGPYPLRRREDPSLMHRVDEEVDFDGRNENERGVMYSESDSPPQHQLGSKQFDNDYSVDDSDVDHADDGTVLHNPIDNSINQTSTNEELLTNRTQILLSETASKPEVIKPHTSFIDKGPLVWSMNEASVSSSSSSSLPKQSIISPNDPPPPLLLPTEHPSITHHDRFSVKSIGSHEYSTGWSDVGERPRKGGIMRSFLRGRSLSMSTTSSGLDRDGHNLWSSSSSDNNMHRWSVEAVIQLVKRLLERIIISLPQYVLSWFVRALIPTHVRRASSILYSIALPGGDATTTAAAAEGVDRRSNWLLLTHMVIYGAVRYVSTLLSIIALPMIVLLVRDAMGAVIIPSSTIAIEPIGAELHGLQTIRVIQHLHMDSLFHFIRYELSSITYYRTFFQQCFNSIQSIDLNEALSHAVIAWRYIQAQCISMLMGALDYLHSSINTIVSTPLLTQAGALIVGVMVIECLFIPYLTSEISSAHVSAAAISKQWSSDDYEDAPLVAVNANDDEPSEQLGSAGTMMAAPIVTYISSVCSSVCRLVAVTSSLLVVTSSLHSSISYSMGSTTLLLLTPYISIALLGTIHLYLLPIPTHRSSSSSSSSSTSDLPIPTTTLSTQEQLYADCSKRVDYLTHLLMSDSWLHHECDRWGLVAYISAWLDREHGHLQSLSRSMALEQRDATIDRVIRSSDDDDDDGRRRESRAVPLKVLMNSLFTAVVVGTALHAALRIMSQQMDDSHTGSHQLFNQLCTAFNAVIQQRSSDIRPQEWVQGVSAAIAKVIVIDPSNLLLRLIYGTTVSDSQHSHRMHTIGSLYSDCLQWMQWDVSSALAVAWMLSPIVIWLHHIQSMTSVDISGSEIISIVQAVMRHTPSIPLPYISNPMSHHNDGSASQRTEQPRRHSSADDHDGTPSGSIMTSPDTAAGIVFKGIEAFIDGRPALKDVQLRFAPGTITVLLNPSSGSTVSTNCLLRLIYHDEGRRGSSSSRSSSSRSIRVDSGSVMVHGGNLKDWHLFALRQKITFLKEEELRFQLQAGAVAGCLPGTAGDSLRAAIQIQEMTGADEVIASLPRGPASVLEGELSTILSDVQWRRLHISRALCHLDKDIVLLCLPTMVLSEEHEVRLLKYLRDTMSKSPQKIIIITTHRISSLIGIDQIVLFSDEGGIIDHLSISELSSQPESRRSPDKSLIMRRLSLTRRMLSHQK